MDSRQQANKIRHIEPLLALIEQRFDVRLATNSAQHLRVVLEHYLDKRAILMQTLGEAATLTSPDYAKAVMISEAARLVLREIAPRPTKKKKKNKDRS